ncbi:MAG TPA: sugar ABC transporter substrate-binding protein [Streptosporangiaceae bacterium]|jgi:simple sugar transport system substrate-binding protein|nr:sugar ABC transporter substrate-binding protein [Streptosporangiaceae bacterium]
MIRSSRRATGIALIALLTLVVAACSSTGGKKAAEQAQQPAAGQASTPRYTIAMITHAAPGDTFWDIIRKGALAAAAKDNINFKYSNDDTATQQATLIQDAINAKVDGIAVTDPNPQAICPTIKKAVQAGIPVVMFNAGVSNWQECGGMSYFGQDESIAGVAAGKRLAAAGAKHVLCVLQAQGQVQLEARCAGVKQGLGSEGQMTKLYVNGTDNSAVLSTIKAKLAQDKSIDAVITLGAPVALIAIQAIDGAGSSAKLYTFDTNAEEIAKIKSGAVQWAVDQQPYVQGYMSVDSLWLYLTNGDILGGGQTVLTGPAFIDASNVDKVATYAERGTR